MTTLKKLRAEIIKEVNSGMFKEDSKIQVKFWNQVIFDARAEILPIIYNKTGFNPAWLQTIEIDVVRVNSGDYGFFRGNPVPAAVSIIDKISGANLGLYKVRGKMNTAGKIEVFEKIPPSMASRLHELIDTGINKSKVYFIGETPFFATKNSLLRKAYIDMVLFDPQASPLFTENAFFPSSPEANNLIKERIFSLDIKAMLALADDNENDSVQEPVEKQRDQNRQR